MDDLFRRALGKKPQSIINHDYSGHRVSNLPSASNNREEGESMTFPLSPNSLAREGERRI